MSLSEGLIARIDGAFVIPELNASSQRPEQVDPAALIMQTFKHHHQAVEQVGGWINEGYGVPDSLEPDEMIEFAEALNLRWTLHQLDNMQKLERTIHGARLEVVAFEGVKAICEDDQRYVQQAQGVVRTGGGKFRADGSKGFNLFAGFMSQTQYTITPFNNRGEPIVALINVNH